MRIARCFLFVFLIVLCSNNYSMSQSSFLVDASLKFQYPVTNSKSDELSFWLFATEDEISETKLQVRNISGPEGIQVSFDAIQIDDFPTTVDKDGIQTHLILQADFFKQPGDYEANLVIKGKTAGGDGQKIDVEKTLKLAIHRLEAQINSDELNDRTILLERSCPWSKASGDVFFSIFEISGKTGVQNLVVEPTGIIEKDSKVLVPGRIQVARQKNAHSNNNDIPPGGNLPLKLSISEMTETGAFYSDLAVSSPTLKERKKIRINLIVSDKVYFPLFVIFLGVLGGWYTHFVAKKFRPRQKNKYRLLKMKAEALKLKHVVIKTEKIARIEDILDNIEKAEEKNSFGDLGEAKLLLDEVEKGIDEMQKEAAVEKAEILKKLRTFKGEAKRFGARFANQTQAEKNNLQDIVRNFGTIENHCSMDEVDSARELLEKTEDLLQGLIKNKLNTLLEEQKTKLMSIQDENGEFNSQISAISAWIAEGKTEEAYAALKQLQIDISQIVSRQTMRGARPLGDTSTEDLSREIDVRQEAYIEISNSPDNRTTDSSIRFKLVDPDSVFEENAKFQWDLGDGNRIENNGAELTHHYDRPGRYQVILDVLDDQGRTDRRIEEYFTILPGRKEKSQEEVRRSIQTSDILVSLISLVLACLAGLLFLYVGKNFGSLKDYILALLWGFGIDNSVRGFSDVLKKVDIN